MKSTATFALTALLAGVSHVAAYTAVVVSDQTWYGWPDNGYNAQVAYDCLGRGTTAGGDGSYDNPLTYATGSDSELHSPCEITWYPFLEKYMVMQDTCGSCTGNHIDIWIGNDQGGQSELDCENSNVPSGAGHKLIRYGSSGHSPNTNALWSYANGCQISENCYPNGN